MERAPPFLSPQRTLDGNNLKVLVFKSVSRNHRPFILDRIAHPRMPSLFDSAANTASKFLSAPVRNAEEEEEEDGEGEG